MTHRCRFVFTRRYLVQPTWAFPPTITLYHCRCGRSFRTVTFGK